jgi:hypothetical protein
VNLQLANGRTPSASCAQVTSTDVVEQRPVDRGTDWTARTNRCKGRSLDMYTYKLKLQCYILGFEQITEFQIFESKKSLT